MNILFAATHEKPEFWLPRPREALPEDRFFAWPDANGGDIDIVLVATPPPGTFAGLRKLKLVQSLWMGVENIVADPLYRREVPLARLVDPGMVAAMAETALAHVLDWHRHLYLYRRWQRERIWKRRRQFLASDRTVAILGLGALGRVAAARLASLGFQVAGYSRTPKEIPGVRCATDLAHALEGADAVVCLLPLTPETRGILDARLFAKIRPGGCVINLARGAHLVVPDLFAALDSGHLAHAWLDVFETEPLPPESPLGTHPAVTVTPHVAALVEPRTAVPKIAEAVNRVRRGELPPYLVDFDRGY